MADENRTVRSEVPTVDEIIEGGGFLTEEGKRIMRAFIRNEVAAIEDGSEYSLSTASRR